MKRRTLRCSVIVLCFLAGGAVCLFQVASACPLGYYEPISYLCAADAYYEFAGVGIAESIYDPSAANYPVGSSTMKSYSFDSEYECACSHPCEIPCVTANWGYAQDSGSGYFKMECPDD